jgi:uncharacterized phage protein gp47/JayE
MAVVIRTRQQIINDLVAAIKGRDTTIETGFGPVKDIVIDPVSLVARELYLQIKRVFDVQFLKNAELMTIEELDLLGESLLIKRKGPRSATGSVFFLTSSKPVSNITVPAGVPLATTPVAASVGFQSFVTTRTAIFYAASADAFFNPGSGFYEFEVPIQAITPGASGNSAAGTIRTLQRQIPTIASVLNKSATSGGRDSETNTEYSRRIRLALLGTDKGTSGGLRRFGLNDSRVVDALVVQSGDPLLIREEQVAGAVDVYILGEEATVDQQPDVYTGLDIAFRNEPLIFPSPVSQVSGSIVGVLTEGVHYFIVRDAILDGSAEARNLLRWNRGAVGLPSLGESLTIEYTYDKLIQDLQILLGKPENDVLANILFRFSTRVDTQLSAKVKAVAEANLSELEDNIRSAITSFVNTRGLGEALVPSDLDLVIRSVPGVDYVFIPFTTLAKLGEQGSETIVIDKNEYASITDSAITVELST